MPGFNKVDKDAIKEIYEKEKIDIEFALISKDLIIATLMKILSIRRLGKVFFLPIKKDLIASNIKEIGLVYKDKILSKYFKTLINYNDFNKSVRNTLRKNNIDYYLYISRSINLDVNKVLNEKCLLSSDYAKANPNIIKKLKENNCKFIIEEYEKIQIDKELLKESEK